MMTDAAELQLLMHLWPGPPMPDDQSSCELLLYEGGNSQSSTEVTTVTMMAVSLVSNASPKQPMHGEVTSQSRVLQVLSCWHCVSTVIHTLRHFIALHNNLQHYTALYKTLATTPRAACSSWCTSCGKAQLHANHNNSDNMCASRTTLKRMNSCRNKQTRCAVTLLGFRWTSWLQSMLSVSLDTSTACGCQSGPHLHLLLLLSLQAPCLPVR